MFLYNITLIVEDEIAEEWLQWMQKVHIPEVMATGKFITNKLWRVIDSPNEGITYSNQYFVDNLEDYVEYLEVFAEVFRNQIQEKYGEKVVSFRSTMQDVN